MRSQVVRIVFWSSLLAGCLGTSPLWAQGTLRRPSLGIEGFEFENRGIIVSKITENSPAAIAGLRAGDLIVHANRRAIRGTADFRQALEESQGQLSLYVARPGAKTLTPLTLDLSTTLPRPIGPRSGREPLADDRLPPPPPAPPTTRGYGEPEEAFPRGNLPPIVGQPFAPGQPLPPGQLPPGARPLVAPGDATAGDAPPDLVATLTQETIQRFAQVLMPVTIRGNEPVRINVPVVGRVDLNVDWTAVVNDVRITIHRGSATLDAEVAAQVGPVRYTDKVRGALTVHIDPARRKIILTVQEAMFTLRTKRGGNVAAVRVDLSKHLKPLELPLQFLDHTVPIAGKGVRIETFPDLTLDEGMVVIRTYLRFHPAQPLLPVQGTPPRIPGLPAVPQQPLLPAGEDF